VQAEPRLLSANAAFLRFLACGGIAAGVNWLSRFAWSLFLPFGMAVTAAYATGMVVAFFLFRRYVFPGSTAPMRDQAWRFLMINLVGMAVTYAVAQLLVFHLFPAIGMTFHAEALGHAIAILAPVATSWAGHKMVTFR
jgi:putative flippase GtrA